MRCDLNVSTSTSSSWAWCSIFYVRIKWFSRSCRRLSKAVIFKSLDSLNFILFSAFRVSCLLTLPTARTSQRALPSCTFSRDVMVLRNARSRPATTGSQRFISFLNTLAPCCRTSSCHDVLRFVARQSCQRQVPLTVLVLDPQPRCRRDLSWTSESRFCWVLNNHAELVTEDANHKVFPDRLHVGQH